MDLASKIREIQKSESENKIRMINEVFEGIELNDSEYASILQIVKKTICDNIGSNKSIVPIELPTDVDTSQAIWFVFKEFNLFIINGTSGTTYLSWNQKFMNDNILTSIVNRLHHSGHVGVLSEELKKIQSEFPQFEIQILLTSDKYKAYELALTAKKNVACVFEDAVYILYK